MKIPFVFIAALLILPKAQADTQPWTHLMKCTDGTAAQVDFAMRADQASQGASTHQQTVMNVTLSSYGMVTDRASNAILAGDISNGRSHWVSEMTPVVPGGLVKSFSLDLSYQDSPIVLTVRDGRQYFLNCVEIPQ